MSKFLDVVGLVWRELNHTKAGDAYKVGFEDAVSGWGKSKFYIELKQRANTIKREDSEVLAAIRVLIDAHDEGYRDGLEEKRMQLGTKRKISFGD